MTHDSSPAHDEDVIEFADLALDINAEVEDADVDKAKYLRDAREEYKSFKDIDRDAEDVLVMSYKKSKKVDTLVKLLKLREPTLGIMSRRYAWLDNEDDMYAEFKRVWLQCVKKYDGRPRRRQSRDRMNGQLIFLADGSPKMEMRRTPFNTYLYTSMRNRIGNLKKRRGAQRLMDGNGRPVCETMKSLDFPLGEDGDLTLKDVIPDENAKQPTMMVEADEIKRILGCEDDPDINQAVSMFCENPSIGTLAEAARNRIGTLRISKLDHRVLSIGVPNEYGEQPDYSLRRKAMAYLGRMIASSKTYAKFEVVNFSLNHNSVNFVVRVNNAALVKKMEDAIAKCRAIMAERTSAVVQGCEDDEMDDELLENIV